jgi:hypothetical protein
MLARSRRIDTLRSRAVDTHPRLKRLNGTSVEAAVARCLMFPSAGGQGAAGECVWDMAITFF